MSENEHSDSEFCYPEDEQEEYDTNFHQFLSNEEQLGDWKYFKCLSITCTNCTSTVYFMPYNKKLIN